ncbi:MAG: hypothetical protein U0359_20290 [Byssovorax sp.]
MRSRAIVLLVSGILLVGCAERLPIGPGTGTSGSGSGSGAGGSGSGSSGSGGEGGGDIPFNTGDPPACDPTITVKSDGRALLVNDPAVLAPFTLERVLKQLLDRSTPSDLTPLSVLQRLFDAENDAASAVFPDVIHCDTEGNPAFKNGAPAGCPRAEGALATSMGMLTPGDPDYFAPIALVNRIDLMPASLQTCGEYRIVFAKQSGKSDPSNRVFLIFEGALTNPSPGDLWACEAVARHWAGLDQEKDPKVIKESLDTFYFKGIPGFGAVVDPMSFGLLATEDDPYGASRGQVRISQRMQDPWEMREMRFLTGGGVQGSMEPGFLPVTVKNNPLPSLFAGIGDQGACGNFQSLFVSADVQSLSSTTTAKIRMGIANEFNAGESALEGPAGPDYVTAIQGSSFAQAITDQLATLPSDPACDGDPLTAEAIAARAATQTCAGCHAPSAFLGPERKIGCNQTWPDSLGGAHIDEKGALSPALKEAFLPRRASVMEAYLRACDLGAIKDNLQPVSGGKGVPPK